MFAPWPTKHCMEYNELRKKNYRTLKPPSDTVSVYRSPVAVEPSAYSTSNVRPRASAVELLLGLYISCPSHASPQFGPGRKKSVEPVSHKTGALSLVDPTPYDRIGKYELVNVWSGVPTPIVPYQRSFESSTSGSEPEVGARLDIDWEKRATPVFLSNAAAPRCNLLDNHWMSGEN